MSLKDDIKTLKEQLSAEERFLESSIKVERFFKRYKGFIIGLASALILAIVAYQLYQYNKSLTLSEANSALNALIKDSNNTAALKTLKKSNQDLYYLYLFKEAMTDQNATLLDEIVAKKNGFTSEIAAYEKASSTGNLNILSRYANSKNPLKDLALLQASYLLMEKGEFDKAKEYLDRIPENSMLFSLAIMYKHYLITKVSK